MRVRRSGVGVPNTYVIQDEQIRAQAIGQILLNAGLFASQELGHDCLQIQRQIYERKRAGVGVKREGWKEEVYRSGEILLRAGDRSAPLLVTPDGLGWIE